MEYNTLGDSDLEVSEICYGTMTFGQQNTLEESSALLDQAVSLGVNFLDAAELYPVPMRADTQGRTEEHVGEWLSRKQRDSVIVATKVSGPNAAFHPSGKPSIEWMRGANRHVDRSNIMQAVEGSLKRLKTDHIDLYQIHWPDRYVASFGAPDYDPSLDRDTVPIEEQLTVFDELVRAGKIRYLGLSNETPWGVSEFCRIAEQSGLPRPVAIQNAFSLVNRVFHIHLAESCRFHRLGLLAYSPLAFGHLTGKYLRDLPPDSRLALFPGFGGRYANCYAMEAVARYAEIAQRHGLTPAELALSYVRTRWFVASTIIGATTSAQLKENVGCVKIELSAEIIREIDAVHQEYPNPAP